jgi:hypothetical protein
MGRLLFDEHPLVILPELAVLIGLNEAVVLQQLHYWLQKSNHFHEGRRWVYNTYDQWQRQFPFWSTVTVRRTLMALRKPYTPKNPQDRKVERGPLVVTGCFNRASFDRTMWWAIDYIELSVMEGMTRRSAQNDQMEEVRMIGPIPETSTERDDGDGLQTTQSAPANDMNSAQAAAFWSLRFIQVDADAARTLALAHDPEAVQRWACIAWARHGPDGVRSPAGFVRVKLETGVDTPDVAPALLREFTCWVVDYRTAKAGI